MKLMKEIQARPRLKRLIGGGLIFLVLFTIFGFFVLPPIVKSVALEKLSEKLKREVLIQKVKINPFLLSLTIQGFTVKEPGNSNVFVSFDSLYLNFQTMSIFRRGLIAKEIRLERPYVNIVRNEDLLYNFSDLLITDKAEPSKPLRFSLNNIQIIGGSIDFLDGPKHTKHVVKDATLTIPFISNLPYYLDTYVQPSFSARVNNHPVSLQGTSKPFADSVETSIDIKIKDLNIPYYLAYAPFRMDYRFVSGLFDTQSSISFTQYKDKKPLIALKGTMAFRNIVIQDNRESPILNLPRVDIGIASSNIMERNFHFSKISIESPEIYFTRDSAGILNVHSLIDRGDSETQGESPKTDAAPFVIRVDETKLDKGMFTFTDYFQDSKFQTILEDVALQVDHFSNARDEKTEVRLSLRTEANETLTFTGNVSLLPLASEGTVEVKEILLKKYSPYYRENILFDVHDGALDIKTHYTYSNDDKAPVMQLNGLEAGLNSLRLRRIGDEKDVIAIPVTTVKDTVVDFEKKDVLIGGLYSQKGIINVKRFKDGKWNLGSLIKGGEWSLRNLLKKPAAPAGKDQKGKAVVPEKPWQITLKSLLAEGYGIQFEDAQPSEPVTMVADRIKLQEENLSTIANTKAKVLLTCRINKTGSVSVNGSFGRNPVTGNLKVNAKTIDIAPFQPYFTDKVKIIVTDGEVSAKGSVLLGYSKVAGVQVTYKGEASLTKFASVDKINAEDFLKWNSLYFSGMDIGYAPLSVNISEVALTDFYSRFIINPDGTMNVQNIVAQEEEKAGVKVAAVTVPQGMATKENQSQDSKAKVRTGDASADKKDTVQKMIRIEKVTLQGGTVNFSDHYIKPNYSANFLEIGGRVTGLSSEETRMADVDLRGKLDNYAPLEISGKINPLREDLYVDLKVDFRDMDLSPVTPYSGRYAGYTIEKGKLSLSLQYLIVKKKLEAQNRVFLDQLTLGDKVDSPDATKLPVKLAIALLKNRKGEIELNLPVTGQLDDPKFSLGSVIIKILINLLVKAATSPFALLGAIFGGGEELSFIDFDPGSHSLGEPGIKKLDTLVKALHDRPALKLEIEGHVDLEKDKEGLLQYLFHKKIKAQKLKEIVKAGKTAVPVDEVKIEGSEYPKYLKMAYKAEKFPKPRNFIGIAKDLPVPEMEKLMLTHIEIKDDDLRSLASRRALTVKDYIIKSGEVEQERVFLVEPKTLQPEKKEKLSDSRVDFRLK